MHFYLNIILNNKQIPNLQFFVFIIIQQYFQTVLTYWCLNPILIFYTLHNILLYNIIACIKFLVFSGKKKKLYELLITAWFTFLSYLTIVAENLKSKHLLLLGFILSGHTCAYEFSIFCNYSKNNYYVKGTLHTIFKYSYFIPRIRNN